MGDPLFSHVKLLCHFDGTAGSTVISDVRGHSATVSGAAISTANAIPGFGQSLANGGGTNGVSFASSTDFDFPGDFTIEFRARITGMGNPGSLLSRGSNGGAYGGWHLGDDGAGNLVFVVNCASGSSNAGNYTFGSFGQIVFNQWAAYAVSRAGTTVRCYKNGSLTYTYANTYGNGGQALSLSAALKIGLGGYYGASSSFQIDDLRLTDAARYTASSYTVDSVPFADSEITYAEAAATSAAAATSGAAAAAVIPGVGRSDPGARASAGSGATAGGRARSSASAYAVGYSGGYFPVAAAAYAQARSGAQAAVKQSMRADGRAEAVPSAQSASVSSIAGDGSAESLLSGRATSVRPAFSGIFAGGSLLGIRGLVLPARGDIRAAAYPAALASFEQQDIPQPEPHPDEVWVTTTEKAAWTRTMTT